jgi:hypothetical protein
MTELIFVRRLPVCVVAGAQWYVEAGVESITFRPGSFGSEIAGAVLTSLDQWTRLWGPHRRANLGILSSSGRLWQVMAMASTWSGPARRRLAWAGLGWMQAEGGMADEGGEGRRARRGRARRTPRVHRAHLAHLDASLQTNEW